MARLTMSEISDFIRQADELRQRAEHEPDPHIRDRLLGMADRYVHLAESRHWSESHPTTVASLTDVFTRRD
jgi:hypothetical protein